MDWTDLLIDGWIDRWWIGGWIERDWWMDWWMHSEGLYPYSKVQSAWDRKNSKTFEQKYRWIGQMKSKADRKNKDNKETEQHWDTQGKTKQTNRKKQTYKQKHKKAKK